MKIAHSVYFTLKDNSDAQRNALVAAGKKYLEPHDGIEFYAMGPRNADMQRDVNDQAYDIALIVVFDNQQSHDSYQVSEPHAQFIIEQKENWNQVRVFDANV